MRLQQHQNSLCKSSRKPSTLCTWSISLFCLHHPEQFGREPWTACAVVGSLWGLLCGISSPGPTEARNIHLTPPKKVNLKYWFFYPCQLVALNLYFLRTFSGNFNICYCLQFCLETRACSSFSNAISGYVN